MFVKFMKRWIIAVLAVLSAFAILSSALEVKAEQAETLVIHYYRYDGAYGPWSLWLWPNEPTPGEGANYTFDGI